MTKQIEPCPFCGSRYSHISHHLLSHSVVCQSCKSTGPHRRVLNEAVREWNLTSRLLCQARCQDASYIDNKLSELEDTVHNLARVLRYDKARLSEMETPA